MTPADTLRAASQRVRELAAKATPGPWRAAEEIDGLRAGRLTTVKAPNPHLCRQPAWTRVVTVGQTRPHFDDGKGLAEANVAWIAAMGPPIAEPLAAWLEATADLLDSEPARPVTPKRPALDLARAILGGGQ